MKERVRQIGGKLEIQNRRNGTAVIAEFPAETQVEAPSVLDQDFSSGASHLNP